MFQVAVLTFAFLVTTVLLLGKRFQRLSHVPGPVICSLTDLYRTYQQNTRDVAGFLVELHDRYGPVVRIGPNAVSVSRASAVPTIYTTRGEFKKATSYNILSTYIDGTVQGSVVNIQDETLSSHLKRAFGAAFTAKNVQDYEHLVDASSLTLVNRLQRKGRVDIFDTLRRFQIDFLLKAAFSEDKSISDGDEDIDDFTFYAQLAHWVRWQTIPKLEYLVYKSLLANKIWELFCTPVRPAWSAMTATFLQGRLSLKTAPRNHRDLLDQWLDAQTKHADTVDIGAVRRMVASTVNAGFDTTAFTMSMIVYELLQNLAVLTSLQQELDRAQAAGLLSDSPRWTEVNKLPYLDAVIKETMRIHPFLNLPLERVVPKGGVEMFGVYLPAGTVIGCSAGVTGQDIVCFGDDAKHFDPTRWLTTDESKRIAMERGSLSFGSGKRGCIGRYIALLEMKKVIPMLVQKFEMKFTHSDTIAESVDGVTNFPKPIEISFSRR